MRLNKKEKWKSYGFVFAMLFIPVVHFLIFWVGVNFNSIKLAFTDIDAETGALSFTLKHFKSLVNNLKTGTLQTAIFNTLLTSAFNFIFLMPWAIFLTYFMYKKIPLTSFWRIMLFLPTVIPAIAMTAIFDYLIDVNGPVGEIWKSMTGQELPMLMSFDKYAKWTVLFYFFWTNFGGQFLLISSAMSRIPKELLEAASLDGAGMWTEFRKVILPLCWPSISMILILNMSSMFTAGAPVLLLSYGMAGTTNINYWIYERVSGAVSFNLSLPAAMGIACTAILFPIIMTTKWLLGRVYKDVEF